MAQLLNNRKRRLKFIESATDPTESIVGLRWLREIHIQSDINLHFTQVQSQVLISTFKFSLNRDSKNSALASPNFPGHRVAFSRDPFNYGTYFLAAHASHRQLRSRRLQLDECRPGYHQMTPAGQPASDTESTRINRTKQRHMAWPADCLSSRRAGHSLNCPSPLPASWILFRGCR